ncbi:hypothetical protein [Halorubrum laminariae]|uniref:Zinc ribbon domain-containing protein n=1 Tax=Halorubrum laminariae TaxID=1433523 RepID=A0ABD6C051_9EURY|nr:hypothetical protein [Halorubrum laminariae]
MYYECAECGLIDRGNPLSEPTVRECPGCGATTTWEPAFEGAADP